MKSRWQMSSIVVLSWAAVNNKVTDAVALTTSTVVTMNLKQIQLHKKVSLPRGVTRMSNTGMEHAAYTQRV